ncbi:MAG TPA: serine/threonine-protein kinase [Gemmatimonadales bacterium]
MTRGTSSEFIALQEALAGRYSLERELGRGGMGIVYLAHEVALDRPVALKLLPPVMGAEAALRERFMREARTAAKLSQPNIVPIYTVEEVARFVFFTMAYVDGETLGSAIRRRGALPGGESSRILREVAWALAYAHAHGVVHRDVKPDNILLELSTGRALVTDFGIAQVSEGPILTGRGEILGTAEFMSPEQASGEPSTERSDIYSLGVVGFYALTGRLPFDGDTVAAVLAKHITQVAPPVASVAPEVPRQLARAIDRCLAKDPRDRFANGEELAAALTRSIEVRREIPVPLRAFINQNREEFRGLSLWAIIVAYGVAIAGVGLAADAPVATFFGGLMTLTVGSVPIGMLFRMTRQLARSGYGHQELLAALREDLRMRKEELAFESGAKRNWIDRLASGLWYGGLGAMGVGTALAVVLDLNAVSNLVLAGVSLLTGGGMIACLVGLPIKALRGSRKGVVGKWWGKFWESRVGKALFKVSRVGLKQVGAGATTFRHTEMAIGMAAERLFEDLPKASRRGLESLPDVVARLERDAQEMRRTVDELNEMLVDARPTAGRDFDDLTPQRESLARDLTQARDVAQARLHDAVTALETIRLALLRMHAGTGSLDGITRDLSAAQDIAADIERLLEGHAEVGRSLLDPNTPDSSLGSRPAIDAP